MTDVLGLTKPYGDVLAVDDLTSTSPREVSVSPTPANDPGDASDRVSDVCRPSLPTPSLDGPDCLPSRH